MSFQAFWHFVNLSWKLPCSDYVIEKQEGSTLKIVGVTSAVGVEEKERSKSVDMDSSDTGTVGGKADQVDMVSDIVRRLLILFYTTTWNKH